MNRSAICIFVWLVRDLLVKPGLPDILKKVENYSLSKANIKVEMLVSSILIVRSRECIIDI